MSCKITFPSENGKKNTYHKFKVEFFILLPSLIAIFWIGIYPKFFFQWFEVYVKQISVLF